MRNKFYHAAISLLVSFLFLVLIYIIFASLEGQYFSNKEPLPVVSSENKISQKLLVGNYAVFSTIIRSGENYEFSLWRYLVGIDSLVKFYEVKFEQIDQPPVVNKFSAESISVHFNNQHTLLHLNGEVIGPAESQPALISPDRNWLAYTDFFKDNQATIYLKNIIDNQSLVVLSSSQESLYPTRDNFRVLDWSADSQILFIKAEQKLYKFFPAKLDMEEVQSLTDLNAENYFLQVKDDIVIAINDLSGVSNMYLINLNQDESRYVFANSAEKIINAYFNRSNNTIIYTLGLDNPQVWQVDISHPQLIKKKFLHAGKLLSWSDDDQLIIQQDQDIYLFSTKKNSSQIIFSSSSKQDLVEINFIDMFKIQ